MIFSKDVGQLAGRAVFYTELGLFQKEVEEIIKNEDKYKLDSLYKELCQLERWINNSLVEVADKIKPCPHCGRGPK